MSVSRSTATAGAAPASPGGTSTPNNCVIIAERSSSRSSFFGTVRWDRHRGQKNNMGWLRAKHFGQCRAFILKKSFLPLMDSNSANSRRTLSEFVPARMQACFKFSSASGSMEMRLPPKTPTD
eukprot:711459-Alexandrium_andersonii.AAC.1